MYRPKDTHERIVHRLKIAAGHLKKVIEMVEQDVYCIDVLHQSQAVQKALRGTDLLLLENHLKMCVADAVRSNRDEQQKIAEVMAVFDSMRS